MDKDAPKDRSDVDNEPIRDEELENVSGGTTADWQDMRHTPQRRRQPVPNTPLGGMIGDLS